MKPTSLGKTIPAGHTTTSYFNPPTDICKCDPLPTCSETGVATLAAADVTKKIKSVTYNGEVIDFATPVLIAGLSKAFSDAISTVESFPSTDVSFVAATRVLTLNHVGQGLVTAVTLEDNTVVTLTVNRKCTWGSECKAKLSVVGTVASLVFGGVTSVLPATAWSATPATQTTNATALATGLNAVATGLAAAGFVATVKPNAQTEMYDITITGMGNFNGKIGGLPFEGCGCTGVWKA